MPSTEVYGKSYEELDSEWEGEGKGPVWYVGSGSACTGCTGAQVLDHEWEGDGGRLGVWGGGDCGSTSGGNATVPSFTWRRARQLTRQQHTVCHLLICSRRCPLAALQAQTVPTLDAHPFFPFLPPAANQKKSVGGHFGGGKVQEMSEQAKESEGGGTTSGQKGEAAEQRGSE